MCHDHYAEIFQRNSFEYNQTSDFVDYLREREQQKLWFEISTGNWNGDEKVEFAPTLTRNGVSYSFNLAEESEVIYTNKTSKDFWYSYADGSMKTKRPWSTGAQPGNKLIRKFLSIDFGQWTYSTCRPPTFVVHSPYELPIGKTLTQFSYKKQVNVWITPEIIETDDELRSFTPDERNCYFQDERKLKYFKTYTKNNCEFECSSFISRLII